MRTYIKDKPFIMSGISWPEPEGPDELVPSLGALDPSFINAMADGFTNYPFQRDPNKAASEAEAVSITRMQALRNKMMTECSMAQTGGTLRNCMSALLSMDNMERKMLETTDEAAKVALRAQYATLEAAAAKAVAAAQNEASEASAAAKYAESVNEARAAAGESFAPPTREYIADEHLADFVTPRLEAEAAPPPPPPPDADAVPEQVIEQAKKLVEEQKVQEAAGTETNKTIMIALAIILGLAVM